MTIKRKQHQKLAGLCMATALAFSAGNVLAQNNARDAAPVDLTGTWVSVVSEDWRWRMVTPARGDFQSVPITEAARAAAMEWDPDVDRANGNECRAYGPGGVMRIPGRVQIEWTGENELTIRTSHGEQTRVFHFNETDEGIGTRQGNSIARWNDNTLQVTTTGALPGYVRRNGIPFSEDAVINEWFVQHTSFGDEWFTVTTEVVDPVNFRIPFVTSTSYKLEPDNSNWNPQPCRSEWGPVPEGDRFVNH